MKILLSSLLIFFSLTVLFGQETEKIKADISLSSVTYAMSHPLHDWEGVNKKIRSIIVRDKQSHEIKKVAVALGVADFNSGNANRDSHAVEVLEGLTYPTVIFISNSIDYQENNIKVSGTLTFHNVKKVMTFSVLHKFLKGKEAYTGIFDVDMTEFNIKRPTLMNMPTDKIIKISFFLVF